MKKKILTYLFACLIFIIGIMLYFILKKPETVIVPTNKSNGRYIVMEYNGVKVDGVVDKPSSNGPFDILLVYHGTTDNDSVIAKATEMIVNNTREIVKKDNVIIIGVAYPEEGLLLGDNIKESEAALLWAKNKASKELGVGINKVYLFGHSQGGYLVTRLNTMQETDGVIANAPGPIDLAFYCNLHEGGKITKVKSDGSVCELLKKEYGSVLKNSNPYMQRSLISFSSGFKSEILFIQGLEDSKIHLESWPKFKEKINQCTDCAKYNFFEIKKGTHRAAFEDAEGREVINDFLLR